jgi:putative tryptophan/tyrosine transport system substrate-binding protein
MVGEDPVRLGLVASLNRPGGTATGVSLISSALGPKRLELLAELLPGTRVIGLLLNPNNPNAKAHAEDVDAAARALGRQVVVVGAGGESEIEAAYPALLARDARALIVQNDPYFDSVRQRLIALSAHHRLPAIYHIREFPAAGGLMSYGPSLADAYHELGVQTARILRGASPAELPVVRPTKFELLINLKTAAALDVAVPTALTVRADAVIE